MLKGMLTRASLVPALLKSIATRTLTLGALASGCSARHASYARMASPSTRSIPDSALTLRTSLGRSTHSSGATFSNRSGAAGTKTPAATISSTLVCTTVAKRSQPGWFFLHRCLPRRPRRLPLLLVTLPSPPSPAPSSSSSLSTSR